MQYAKTLCAAARCFRLWGPSRQRPGDGKDATTIETNARARPHGTGRRGSALILTLVLTLGLASLATSAIYLGSNARLITDSYDRDRDLRYSAEAVLAIGKSMLNSDPNAVPFGVDTTVFQDRPVNGADSLPVPGVTTSLYIGRTSSNTGQFGAFVSVVAIAKNSSGAQVIRRLELAQESFAKFAYWSNQESNNGQPIFFDKNDQLWGPVWSNDMIRIGPNGGAHFHDDVGTAATVSSPGYGIFDKGYSENKKPIQMPPPSSLNYLAAYASAGSFNFDLGVASPPMVDQVMSRIEFVAKPVDDPANPDSISGANDGFFRIYTATATGGAKWLRGDFTPDNCGASYVFVSTNGTGRSATTRVDTLFVPLSEHRSRWFVNALNESNLYTQSTIASLTKDSINTGTSKSPTYVRNNLQAVVLAQPSARCYLGGDPHLRAVNLRGSPTYTLAVNSGAKNGNGTAAALGLAGNDTTFTGGDANSTMGSWKKWPANPVPNLTARWPGEAPYLFPLSRAFNPSTKGVIYVNGTVGISGTLRGRVTLYASGNVAVLDDLKYVTDPALNKCSDILGVISANDIMVADNALNDPPDISGGGMFLNMDDTKDLYLDGVLMAMHTAFGAEHYNTGAANVNNCQTVPSGRGCLFLNGGIIQQQRGPVGYGNASWGTGYVKRYSYDKCALYNPPPYFPTTGRYTDNRYYELDPAGFDVTKLFTTLAPK